MADIELVIKIPEEIRLALINNIQLSLDQQSICDSCIKQAIVNGTPLPKGHGRLIEDTLELERELWTYTRYTGIDEAPYENATKVIDEAPTIIAACTLADADGGDAQEETDD